MNCADRIGECASCVLMTIPDQMGQEWDRDEGGRGAGRAKV
jgi:hypothetical protein